MLVTCALAGSVLMLGGCNDTTKADNARLTEENAKLQAANQQTSQELVTAKMQYDSLKANPPAAQPAITTGTSSPPPAAPKADVVIEVAGDVLFASGSTALQAAGKKELDKVAASLKGRYASNRVRVEGYTDSDPIKRSKFPSNEALSEQRAESVRAYLVSKGVNADRLTIVGMGSAKPRATKAASRRVEIVVVGG
ncbi:MAG: OmpA/MotB family protein [Phycisphaerales bacterium]